MNKLARSLVSCLTVLVFLAAVPAAYADDLTFITDKGCYNLGSQVKLSLTNGGQQAITLMNSNPWDVYSGANLVYSPIKNGQLEDLDAGSTKTWLWSQKNSNGVQVLAGSYNFFMPANQYNPNNNNNEAAAFTIAADADEDCKPDTSDPCPFDSTDKCKGEQVVEVIKPIAHHVHCVGNTRVCINPSDDPDGDGATEAQGDKCNRPGQSGPESNHYCPDRELKATHAKEFVKQKEAALASTGWWWVVPGGGFLLAYYEVTNTQDKLDDANDRIAHDPPDSNYKEIAKLEIPQYVSLPETDETNYLTNKYAAVTNNYIAAAQAFVHSNERFMGAQQANDVEWTQTQAKMTRFYALKTADALNDINSVLTEEELYLAKTGSNGILTKAQLQEFQNQVRANGVSALPSVEVNFAKNNLLMSDAEVAHLVDHILEVNPADWKEESVLDKIENYKAANNNFIISLENLAAKVGANLYFVKASDGAYELHVDNAPSDVMAGMILMKVRSDGPLPSSATVSAGDMPVNIKTAALSSDWQAIFLFSTDGVKAGSSGILAKINIPKEEGLVARPEIAWMAGFPNWIVEDRRTTVADSGTIKFVSVASATSPPAQPPVSQIAVFKNGAWVFVNAPTTQWPSGAMQGTSWWDGSAWITSPPPQYGVVWTGSGWSGTGPGTIPPKGVTYVDSATPLGKINAWNGYQYVLADKAVVDAAPPASSWPMFDVGTMAWTFTSVMPPNSP